MDGRHRGADVDCCGAAVSRLDRGEGECTAGGSEDRGDKDRQLQFCAGNGHRGCGTRVTWTNHDDIPHTAVSTDGVFKSKVMDTDEKFSYTFTTPGTFPYFCSIHPKMTGTIVVQ